MCLRLFRRNLIRSCNRIWHRSLNIKIWNNKANHDHNQLESTKIYGRASSLKVYKLWIIKCFHQSLWILKVVNIIQFIVVVMMFLRTMLYTIEVILKNNKSPQRIKNINFKLTLISIGQNNKRRRNKSANGVNWNNKWRIVTNLRSLGIYIRRTFKMNKNKIIKIWW